MKSLRTTSLVIVQPLACITSFAALSACGQAMLPTVSRDNDSRVEMSSTAGLVPVKIDFQQAGLNLNGQAASGASFSLSLGGLNCWFVNGNGESIGTLSNAGSRITRTLSSTIPLFLSSTATGCSIELKGMSLDGINFSAPGMSGLNLTTAGAELNFTQTPAPASGAATSRLVKVKTPLSNTQPSIVLQTGNFQSEPPVEVSAISASQGVGIEIETAEVPAITLGQVRFTSSSATESSLEVNFTCSGTAEASVNISASVKSCVVANGPMQRFNGYRAKVIWLSTNEAAALSYETIRGKLGAIDSMVQATATESRIRPVPVVPPQTGQTTSIPHLVISYTATGKLPGYKVWKLTLPAAN